jgi:hypothetical protein
VIIIIQSISILLLFLIIILCLIMAVNWVNECTAMWDIVPDAARDDFQTFMRLAGTFGIQNFGSMDSHRYRQKLIAFCVANNINREHIPRIAFLAGVVGNRDRLILAIRENDAFHGMAWHSIEQGARTELPIRRASPQSLVPNFVRSATSREQVSLLTMTTQVIAQTPPGGKAFGTSVAKALTRASRPMSLYTQAYYWQS